eukprot:COSAG05_NODE_6256_length_990_cov_2.424242_1_plen_64_part_10
MCLHAQPVLRCRMQGSCVAMLLSIFGLHGHATMIRRSVGMLLSGILLRPFAAMVRIAHTNFSK